MISYIINDHIIDQACKEGPWSPTQQFSDQSPRVLDVIRYIKAHDPTLYGPNCTDLILKQNSMLFFLVHTNYLLYIYITNRMVKEY